jgi:hypothetical protein
MADTSLDIFNLNDLPTKPWQRIAAQMFATGTPVHEIASQITQPIHLISDFLTSKRGTELIKTVLADNEERLNDLLDAAAIDSLLTLIKIRDTSPNDTARIAASREILSKTLPGVKARDQRKSTQTSSTGSPEEEIERLRLRIAGSI